MNALDLLYSIAGVLSAPFWARKARQGWSERMGHVQVMLQNPPGADGSSQADRKPRILLHAVSVGEVNALRPLVPLLAEQAQVIVCTTTDTGLARAQQLFSASAEVVRYPLDFSWAVRRFLELTRPDAVGLVELELWPNFLKACQRRSIPVSVINGRLSARSFKGYWRWRRIVKPLMFSRLFSAAVQDEAYAERFTAMGVSRVSVTGSMKWDSFDVSGEPAEPSEEARALGRAMGIDPNRPLIVGGSTGPGEEALLHEACSALVERVQLACAPRKPDRFDQAQSAMPGCERRSSRGHDEPSGSDRYLLDTIGELGLLYQLADLVVVGRSFFDLYGSDPIEPIAMGRAVVMGPAVSDFETVVAVFEAAHGVVRADRKNLSDVLSGLMGDSERRINLGKRGRGCIREQQGAAVEHAEMLLKMAKPQVIASKG